MIVSGGKSVYGAPLGILMLQARFPRIPGDMGNATTWPFPVRYKVVRGASPDKVVRDSASGLLPVFLDAAQELVKEGCRGITTNCGFLSLFQKELTESLGVPVATSSLMQASAIQALLPPGQRVGIVTISAETLTQEHLIAARVPAECPIVGTEQGAEFTRVILNDELEMDVDAARKDMLDASRRLVDQHKDVGAVLFECTNMVPYAADVQTAIGLPVFTIRNFVTWFYHSLQPDRFTVIAGNQD